MPTNFSRTHLQRELLQGARLEWALADLQTVCHLFQDPAWLLYLRCLEALECRREAWVWGRDNTQEDYRFLLGAHDTLKRIRDLPAELAQLADTLRYEGTYGNDTDDPTP